MIDGRDHQVMRIGDVFQDHMLMAIISEEAPFVVLEDFARRYCHMLIVDKIVGRHDQMSKRSMTINGCN